MTEEQEEWFAIEGWPYEVSTLARVRRTTGGIAGATAGRVLKEATSRGGYKYVVLCRDADFHRRMAVHRIVCTTFHGPPLPGQEVRHLDGSRDNNRPYNVRWGSTAENAADRYRHGTVAFGDDHPNTILADANVRSILDAWERAPRGHGKTGQFIAAMQDRYGIKKAYVESIIYRRLHRADRGARLLNEPKAV